MAIYTQLSPSATPGKRYSFLAKEEAIPESGPHTGTFTALSVSGTPGPIHSFLAKTEAAPEAGEHTGRFTALSVLGLPGGIRVFSAKTEADEDERLSYAVTYTQRMRRIAKEDREILELVEIIVTSGMLN